ncbi:MAG: ROK family protein [Planctomycetes bacterium]|jgi:glucokinase|nr:ROK family protein [Planctomycetota bacterium]
MRTVLAGDLGGTKCRFALISADFGVHGVQHVPTVRERGPFLAALERAIETILSAVPAGLERPTAAGFGTAGVIPRDGRSIEVAPNLPLDGFPLAQHVEARFGLRTTLLNDGRASAWGEFLRGHAAGRDPLLCLFFGTGIGIGLIVDGKPFAGATNAAGEIGHTTFRPGGRRCPCGGLGHFEAYCGGRAITERALAEIGPPPATAASAPSATGWTVGAVVRAAATPGPGQAAAQAILAEAEAAACALVANACTLLNPGAVVLGGGVLSGWPLLQERIVAHVPTATSRPIHRDLQFVPTLGGSDAILWGAAAATCSLWSAG